MCAHSMFSMLSSVIQCAHYKFSMLSPFIPSLRARCMFSMCWRCALPVITREREREREIVSSYVMYISYNTYIWIVLPIRICSHPHSMSACACFVCFHTQRAEALFDVLYVALFCKLDSWIDLGAYAHAFMLKVCHYTRQCARDSFYVISICHAENMGECFS